MLRRLFSSLRYRLLLVVLLAVVPALGVIVNKAAKRQRASLDEAAGRLTRTAEHAGFAHREAVAAARAQLGAIARLLAGREPCAALSELDLSERYAGWGLADEAGRVSCGRSGVASPADLSSAVWFPAAKPGDGFLVRESPAGPFTGRPALVATLPLDEGARRVLFVCLPLSSFPELARQSSLPDGAVLAVVSPAGAFLASWPDDAVDDLPPPDRLRTLLGLNGTAEETDAAGVRRLYAVRSLEGAEGQQPRVVVGVAMATISLGPQRELASDIVLLVLVALLAGVAAWIAGDALVVKPIRALIAATQRVGAGELATRAGASEPGEPKGELGELTRAFDEMAAALQQRERDRIRAAEALITSHDRFQLAAKATQDAIWDWNLATDEVFWGEGFARLFGKTEPPTVDDWTESVHPDDRVRVLEGLDRVVNTGGIYWSDEYRYLRSDGSYAVVLDRGYVQRDADGKPVRMIGAMADISDRRAAEERLKRSYDELRALSARLSSVREEEGRRISREIHDGLGQSLTAVKMDLAWLRRHAADADGTAYQARVAGTSRLVDELMETVHRVSAELRPGLLDDLGLAAAIEWQVSEFAKRYGIEARATIAAPAPSPSDKASTAAFRILQEALTNVARHSHASRVAVRLAQRERVLVLEVEDNGRGITEREQRAPRSLGLIGMRERATLVGGTIEVNGRHEQGTLITVRLPLQPPVSGVFPGVPAGG